jgi:hypothetical protein
MKLRISILSVAVIAVFILFIITPTIPVTGGIATSLDKLDRKPMVTDFDGFIQTLGLKGGDEIVGIFAQNKIALEVVQQPKSKDEYVSLINGTATQFRIASLYGSYGFLAHNFLSGDSFFTLEMGDEIQMIDANGKKYSYLVSEISSYEAIDPLSVHSDFIDLQTGERIRNLDLFYKIYDSDNRLVLQTCIEKDGDLEWGRLFVIAEPSI